jgi:phage-related protein
LQAAETQLAEAEAAVIAAQATFDAALAALPPNDPIFNNDQCGKRLTSCRLRFGLSTLPFGAFPGANLFR